MLRQVLALALESGDVVIMETLPGLKVAGVREAIRPAQASLVYLPVYSPDLNPIEQDFATLKALFRKAAARMRDTLWRTIGPILDAYMPDEGQLPCKLRI